jgi:hypothetical protein
MPRRLRRWLFGPTRCQIERAAHDLDAALSIALAGLYKLDDRILELGGRWVMMSGRQRGDFLDQIAAPIGRRDGAA